MITEQRLQWLRDNKIHGEIAIVVKKMNPTNKITGISQQEARSIITGRLVGKWGEAFCDALETKIKSRQRKENAINKKYA